jgi:hypothetical protein
MTYIGDDKDISSHERIRMIALDHAHRSAITAPERPEATIVRARMYEAYIVTGLAPAPPGHQKKPGDITFLEPNDRFHIADKRYRVTEDGKIVMVYSDEPAGAAGLVPDSFTPT